MPLPLNLLRLAAFAARNLALKPALDALLNVQFAELAKRNADEFLALLFAESGVDSQRSQDWSATLVRYALERRPELAGVLAGQLALAPEVAEAAVSRFSTARRSPGSALPRVVVVPLLKRGRPGRPTGVSPYLVPSSAAG